jgi:hypothetical protein
MSSVQKLTFEEFVALMNETNPSWVLQCEKED